MLFVSSETNNYTLKANKITVETDLFEEAVKLIIEHEGWHDHRHYPYIGYGHRLLPGEKLTHNISKEQATELVRKDLRIKCSYFRSFDKDSLILGTLAYNVGENRVHKSERGKKLHNGDRDIYLKYISFCRVKGRDVKSI